jgi:hypothetical protein
MYHLFNENFIIINYELFAGKSAKPDGCDSALNIAYRSLSFQSHNEMEYWVGGLSGFAVLFLALSKKPAPRVPQEEVQLSAPTQVENGAFYDIVIVGAGISGISAAYEFLKRCPNKVSQKFSFTL